jgi:hypothetical protein
MAAEHVVGAVADVRTAITAVDNTATPPTATVRVIDDNGNFVTPNVVLPQTLVRVTGVVVAVGDVLENISDSRLPIGTTAVVRWVDPLQPFRWSPSLSQTPALSSQGWKKIGAVVLP